jgi:hypothetical protein
MATKSKTVDVIVVPSYDKVQARRSAGGYVMSGGVKVISVCAHPRGIDGLKVGAIHVDDRCLTDPGRYQQESFQRVLATLALCQRKAAAQ